MLSSCAQVTETWNSVVSTLCPGFSLSILVWNQSCCCFFYKHLQFFWRGNLWSEGEKRWVWGGGTSNGCIYRIPGVNYICSRAKLICNLCTTFMAPTQELAAPCLLEARAARDRCSDFLSSFSVLKMHQLSTSLKSSSKAFFQKTTFSSMTGRVRFGRQMMKLLQQTVRNYFIVLGQAYTFSNLNSIQLQYFKNKVSSSTPHSRTMLLCK